MTRVKFAQNSTARVLKLEKKLRKAIVKRIADAMTDYEKVLDND